MGSYVHGFLQARTLECVASSFSRNWICVSCIVGKFFIVCHQEACDHLYHLPFDDLPREGNGTPCQYPCLGKSHGQRSLVGYSPWGCKESDTTERLHFWGQGSHLCLWGLKAVSGSQHWNQRFMNGEHCSLALSIFLKWAIFTPLSSILPANIFFS